MTTEKIDLQIRRHSCAHLMAAAVQVLWPETKFAIGPAIDEGFYYDFDLPQALSPEDLVKIEAKMSELKKQGLAFERQELTIDEAIKQMRQAGQIYKVELLEELKVAGETKVSFYQTGEFVDLCRGPHLASTKEIGSFKLLSLAGAYWRGDEKNKMLTRIYGTCFAAKEELAAHLNNLEEAKKRDHRVIGKNLNLFVFSDLVGKGLPLLTEKGSVIRRELERYIVDEEIKRGYKHVYTPDIAKVDLYRKSGHYPYYKDTMYPVMKVDEEELILRPMTCPHHFELYLSKPRSYKELPVRFAELAKQFRYEKSGELTGLMRVRSFCLADAHIVCRKDQAVSEINSALNLIEDVATVLGLKKGENYRYRLSLGDRKEEKKYYKDDEAWDSAEDILRKVLTTRESPFFEAVGEAAFYGPKIDIQMKNWSGGENTAFTVQYDFVMPKRFKLVYNDSDGQEKEAIVIHRSSIGAFERVMAFLIEHYAGAFPVWLSPVQAQIITVSDKFNEYGEKVLAELKEVSIRAELDSGNDSLGKKIRNAEKQKIPYVLVVGEKEEKAKSVGVRARSQGDLGEVKLSEFIKKIIKEVIKRT
ncbi:MAG: threonine--tRNA ligase [Candidatus Buchananbacteria bacterium]